MLSRKLNFRQPVSKKLTKVTIVCVDTDKLTYHHAVLACQPMSRQRADVADTVVMHVL